MTRVSGPDMRAGVVQIVAGVLVTALLTGAILWSAWESWHSAVSEARRASAQVAATIASQAGDALGRGAAIADDLRLQVIRDPTLLAPGNPRLAASLESIGSAAPAGMVVALADGDGVLVGSSRQTDPRAGSLSIARQPSFQVHKDAAPGAGHGVVISRPSVPDESRSGAFVISMAIRDERDRLLGVAAVSVPAGRAFRHLGPVPGGTASHVALVHRDGYVLTRAPDPAGEPVPVRPVSAWAQDPDGRAGTIEGASPFSYRRAIVSHQAVADFPVDAVVAHDMDDVFARWRGDRFERLIVYGVMIVAAIGLNLWLFLAVRGRLRAEADLRESSEGRFTEFASIASDWFWETDAEHRFTFVSEGVSSLGVPPDTFLGKKRSERAQALPGPVSPRLIELERLMDLHRPIRGHVFDAVMQNSERRWYEVSARPHVDGDGTFRGYRGVARDVTALHDAQDRIAASEARLIDSINSMPIGYALWNARDRLVACNRRYVEMWPTAGDLLQPGITFAAYIEKAMRRAWTEIPEAELQERIAERISRHANCGAPWIREFPDGRIIEFSEVRTTDGGIVSLYSDVTERQGMLKRVAESEARFHDFADSASDWFWETGPDHRFTYVSAGLRKIGKDPGALIGRTREEHARAHGREPAAELAELAAILDRREVIRGFCFSSSPNSAGVRHTLEIHGKPIFDAAGGFLGYRGIGRDVTLRNQQQAELARALSAEREMNAQQRRFVSIASHEFRTPLAVIDGATQRLISALRGAEDETQKRLARIRGAVSRMTELIERTLSSARLDEGRIEIETQFFDLAGLVRDVIDRQRQISPGFEIVADSNESELGVEGDPKLLEQVFSNLLSNAVKYSGRSRRVDIVVHATADAVDVAVRDHGLGIHADEVPQLFTRFFRARSSMGIPGTGIGLHLVRELVLMHGGRVDVGSAIGTGTTFTVTLPRRQRAVAVVDAAQ